MDLNRRTSWRSLLRRAVRSTLLTALLLTSSLLVLPVAPALAHNGTGGASSDYRITLTGWIGDPTGVELRVIELGNRVELSRNGADEVLVLGYEQEPYVRLDEDGVWENTNSPAHYLNADRFAATRPPESAGASAPVAWVKSSEGDTVRWHDHRAHWMSPTPPVAVSANPEIEQVVHTDHIDLVIDGRTARADIAITWLPRPHLLVWLTAASVLGALGTVGIVLVPRVRRLVPIIVPAAAIAATVGQGSSSARLVTGAIIVLVALLAAASRNRAACVFASSGAAVLAITRLEVFEHQLLAGPPASWQRVSIVAALGLGLSVAASAMVDALGPTHADGRVGPRETQRRKQR